MKFLFFIFFLFFFFFLIESKMMDFSLFFIAPVFLMFVFILFYFDFEVSSLEKQYKQYCHCTCLCSKIIFFSFR